MNSKNTPSIFTVLKDTKFSELIVLTVLVLLLDSRKATVTDCYPDSHKIYQIINVLSIQTEVPKNVLYLKKTLQPFKIIFYYKIYLKFAYNH